VHVVSRDASDREAMLANRRIPGGRRPRDHELGDRLAGDPAAVPDRAAAA